MDSPDQPRFFYDQGERRFEVKRRLGEGGFGVVYHVFDRKLKQDVALKTLKAKNAEALLRFKDEFRALIDIKHPNLVSIYESFSDGHQWFFTMEFIEGVDLLSYIRKSPLSPVASPLQSTSPPQPHVRQTITKASLRTPAPPSASSPAPPKKRPLPKRVRTMPAETPEAPPQEISHVDTQHMSDEELEASFSKPSSSSIPILQNETSRHTSAHRQSPAFDSTRLRHALKQLTLGIQALHQAGKLHRDLKPSNILVTPSERVVILDFGLVFDFAPENLHSSIQLAGTPAYMPPEQATTSSPTEASDWYSVGAVLYEALANRPPFEGHLYQILQQKQQQLPISPTQFVEDLPTDLETLCMKLLSIHPEERPGGQDILQTLGSTEHITTSTVRKRRPFVGRQSALRTLHEALRLTQQGTTTIVHITGPSGIGKSQLVRRFLKALQQQEPQSVLLSSRCYKQESVPYKAIDGLMDNVSRYLSALPQKQVEPWLPTDIRELSLLFPVLRRVEAIKHALNTAVQITDSQELRERAFKAFRELINQLTSRRLVLMSIDDLQWGDEDSASLLNTLLSPPHAPPVMLIVSYRDGERDEGAFLKKFSPPAVHQESTLHHIKLKELSLEDAKELALGLLGEDVFPEKDIQTLVQESGGNPLFLETVLRFLRADQNPKATKTYTSLEALLSTHIEKLPEQARHILQLVAIAGQPVRRATLRQQLKDIDEGALMASLQAEYLLRVHGVGEFETVDTYHNKLRELLLHQLDSVQQQRLHATLAQALEQEPQVEIQRLATHYQKAGDPEKALSYLLKAAKQSAETFAFAHAASLYELAFQFSNDDGIVHKREHLKAYAKVLANAGRSVNAAAAYKAASELSDNLEERYQLQRRAGQQLLRSGHLEEALTLLTDIIEQLNSNITLASTPLRAFISWLYHRTLISLHGLDFDLHSHKSLLPQDKLLLDTANSLSRHFGMVDPIRGADLHAKYLRHALRSGDVYRISLAISTELAYSSTYKQHDTQATQRLFNIAFRAAKQTQHPHAIGSARLAAGIVLYTQGRWKRALSYHQSAEQIFREQCTDVFWERANAQIYTFNTQLFLGAYADIIKQLPRTLKEAEERGDRYARTFLRSGILPKVYIAQDDIERAHDEVDEALKEWSQQGFSLQHYIEILVKGELALYRQDVEDTWQQLTQRHWPRLKRAFILRSQFHRIEITNLRGRLAIASATSHLQNRSSSSFRMYIREATRAAKQIAQEGMHWSAPLSELLYAGIASLQGDRHGALQHLLTAEVGFELVDMELYAQAARLFRDKIHPTQRDHITSQTPLEVFQAQGIKKPETFARMLIPGAWEMFFQQSAC
tara:strand:- start:1675 stop:5703 length:4029 start_codon:yes stop_codon:yes gene_type:complete